MTVDVYKLSEEKLRQLSKDLEHLVKLNEKVDAALDLINHEKEVESMRKLVRPYIEAARKAGFDAQFVYRKNFRMSGRKALLADSLAVYYHDGKLKCCRDNEDSPDVMNMHYQLVLASRGIPYERRPAIKLWRKIMDTAKTQYDPTKYILAISKTEYKLSGWYTEGRMTINYAFIPKGKRNVPSTTV